MCIRDRSSNSKDIQKLTFAEIIAMPCGERYTLFKENVVKPFGAIAKAKDTATEKMHMAFKVVASLKRDYAAMLHGKEIAPDTTEAKFFKDMAGGDVPARVKQLATFFNAVVLTGDKPLISETNIDAASVNSLEKAASIIATERKNSPDVWKMCIRDRFRSPLGPTARTQLNFPSHFRSESERGDRPWNIHFGRSSGISPRRFGNGMRWPERPGRRSGQRTRCLLYTS